MRPLLFAALFGLFTGCLPKTGGTVAATAAQAPAADPVDPVYFATGSSKLASQADQDHVAAAAARSRTNASRSSSSASSSPDDTVSDRTMAMVWMSSTSSSS